MDDFDSQFQALTGNLPFPWQRALYHRFLAGDIPPACILPTGLGKTMTLAVWLLALAEAPTKVPRRLVYVVNRRTVVDQSTTEAEKLRERLDRVPQTRDALAKLCAVPHKVPLAISTLRGQFADNEEWRTDPARPAILCGTVDMIGSRLLFNGYRCGYKTRPLHAGLLGYGSLLIHDEAHLEPAFQTLLDALVREQERCGEAGGLNVMQLTATVRGTGKTPFELTDADRENSTVLKRIQAKKTLRLHEAEEKEIPDRLIGLAKVHAESGQAILVFARTVEAVEKIAGKLGKKTATLTGTMRGKERDDLARTNRVFARFLPEDDRKGVAEEGTVYLVCTSAGEVGVNLSADHLVCDLSPFDSMAQRFGRVNRFGTGEAFIDVVYPKAFKEDNPLDARRRKTLDLLRPLKGVSPWELATLNEAERQAAFSPEPQTLPTSDFLFDAWSMTTIRERLSGRPPVADWLHGVAEWEPPQTQVAWREDVARLARVQQPETEEREGLLSRKELKDLLEAYPLKPLELLHDRTDRVFKHVKAMANRTPDAAAWLMDEDGNVESTTLKSIAEGDKEALEKMTLVLEPKAGGLAVSGLLDGSVKFDDDPERYDVADLWGDGERRRTWTGDDIEGMRQVFLVKPDPDSEEEEPAVYRWFVKPASATDEANSRAARQEQLLQPHLDRVGELAALIASRLGEEVLVEAFREMGRCHDLGKGRDLWQRSIGNHEFPEKALAKSDGRKKGWYTGYRHEFGSLSDITRRGEFQALTEDLRELALHVVATHHGRGRPHFPEEEAFDPLKGDGDSLALARAVPQRFARLQQKHGRWRLAYLESILRAADYLASEGK